MQLVWYNIAMKKIMVLDLVSVSEIAKVTETSSQNILNTYINNINGKNKKQMLKALAYGAYMMEEKLTPKDVKLARRLALAVKDSNGK